MIHTTQVFVLLLGLSSYSNSKRELAQSNGSSYLHIGGGVSVRLNSKAQLIIDDAVSGPFAGSYAQGIFGDDLRVQVLDTTLAPFSSIGQVGQLCSGIAIGPRHILTAAHCIYDRISQTYRADNKFTPGRDGQYAPFGTYDWEFIFIPDGYKSQIPEQEQQSDYALIILKEQLDPAIQILPFGNACISQDYVYALNVAGYPSDLEAGVMYTTGCTDIQFDCGWKVFYHLCDTFGGMSGSGMFSAFYRSDNELSFSIKAIHTAFDIVAETNTGIIITEELERQLRYWIEYYN